MRGKASGAARDFLVAVFGKNFFDLGKGNATPAFFSKTVRQHLIE